MEIKPLMRNGSLIEIGEIFQIPVEFAYWDHPIAENQI